MCQKLPSFGLKCDNETTATQAPTDPKAVCQGVEYPNADADTDNAAAAKCKFISSGKFDNTGTNYI